MALLRERPLVCFSTGEEVSRQVGRLGECSGEADKLDGVR